MVPHSNPSLHRFTVIGPIPWGHSGSLCHAFSLSSSWTSMRRRRPTVPLATPGELGVRRLAVANGPNIFQMLLVFFPLPSVISFRNSLRSCPMSRCGLMRPVTSWAVMTSSVKRVSSSSSWSTLFVWMHHCLQVSHVVHRLSVVPVMSL